MPLFNVHYHQQVGHELLERQALIHATDAHDAKVFVEAWIPVTVTRVEQEVETPRPRSETVSLNRGTLVRIRDMLDELSGICHGSQGVWDWTIEDQQALDKLKAALDGE